MDDSSICLMFSIKFHAKILKLYACFFIRAIGRKFFSITERIYHSFIFLNGLEIVITANYLKIRIKVISYAKREDRQ